MEAYVQDVFNKYDLGKKGLDIEEQKLVKDIVHPDADKPVFHRYRK